MKKSLLFGAAGILLASTAMAQNGTDTCTTPTPVGEGSFAFNTSSMAGSQQMNCVSGYDMHKDMFWIYTATIDGLITFDTEGSSFDTQIAVFSGTNCLATCVDDDDDGGSGLISSLTISGVNIGDQFVVQVGGYDIEHGAGVLNIGDVCAGILDDPYEDNDDCTQAVPITPASYNGLTVIGSDSDFFQVRVHPGETLTLTETSDSNRCDYSLFDSCGGFLNQNGPISLEHTNFTGSFQDVIIEAYQNSFSLVQCSTYSFDLDIAPNPCIGVLDDTFEDNDDCTQAVGISPAAYGGLTVIGPDDDYYLIRVFPGEVLTWTETFDSNLSCRYDLFDACGGNQIVNGAISTFSHQNLTGNFQDVIVRAFASNPGVNCSNYNFTFTVELDPCFVLPDDSFEDNDNCSTATPISDGTMVGLAVFKNDKDHYSFCVADGETVLIDVIFDNSMGDLDAFLRDAAAIECGTGQGANLLASGTTGSDHEGLAWTNSTGAHLDVVLEVQVWDNQINTDCNNYDLVISGTDCSPTPAGTPFCSSTNANSTGALTTLTGFLGTGVESGLRLEVSNGVPMEFGYFLIGTGVDESGFVISDGLLCLSITGGNSFSRYNFGSSTSSIGQFNAAGQFQNLVGTATSNGDFGYDVATINPFGGTIMSGETWHFQLWHRDTPSGVGHSNLSTGLSVTFP